MKEKVAIHLNTLTGELLTGVNFQNLEMLGFDNVKALLNFVSSFDVKMEKEIEEVEASLSGFADDVLEIVEIASYIAYMRIKVGNMKLVQSSIKTILGNLKQTSSHYPLLPSLRIYKPFEPGDEVMCYIGETRLETEQYPYDRSEYIPEQNWVCAKVLSFGNFAGEYPTVVFFNNPVFVKGSLGGHYNRILTSSPCIFKRDEFFKIRKMIMDNVETSFLDIFFKNCRYSPYRYTISPWTDVEHIKKMITDPNVENTTDEELVITEEERIRKAVELTRQYRTHSNDAENMAIKKGVKLD